MSRARTSLAFPLAVLFTITAFAGWRQCNPPQTCQCAHERARTSADTDASR